YSTLGINPDAKKWRVVPASKSACDTPQMLTDALQDYMSFAFNGTGVAVIGTLGVKQGLIKFRVDGGPYTTIDRGRPKLECDKVLYKVSNLPWGEHSIEGVLVGQGTNPDTGKKDGVFSVQRIKYTVPNDVHNG
ncbi:hypothetical protein FS837_003562, partial [Tulasnella sp. UAMH 9824]